MPAKKSIMADLIMCDTQRLIPTMFDTTTNLLLLINSEKTKEIKSTSHIAIPTLSQNKWISFVNFIKMYKTEAVTLSSKNQWLKIPITKIQSLS